jgi:hypothetical protein
MLSLPAYTDLQEKKKEGLPPNFLWSLVALANLMRLSLLKAAHAVMSGAAYRKFGSPGFPVEFGGVGEPLAAFLTESRTRGHVWCSVQEIRVAHLVQPMYAKLREHGAPVQGARLGGKPEKRRTKRQPTPETERKSFISLLTRHRQ